jgi:integration host factor subunit beta
MTKSELIQRLAKRFPRLMQRDIEQLVNTFLNEISDTLCEEGRVELRGFGAFSVRRRNPRKARNPKNGAEVTVGTRYSIYFRTGKELRDQIKDLPVTA